MNNLVDKVEQWSVEKGINEKATLITQWIKMHEEVHEVECAIDIHNHNRDSVSHNELELEIGDVIVTAIILAQLHRTDAKTCLEKAYNKIKDRTGKMINGTFVKSADLNNE
jgi:NTP pyrophosphatase (non-canonical NTP hydrolase)